MGGDGGGGVIVWWGWEWAREVEDDEREGRYLKA